MDVWDYFHRRDGEHRELSLRPDRRFGEMFQASEGSDDRRGRIYGSLFMNETARIDVLERIIIRANGHPFRVRYAYFLIIDGYEVWGEERHRTHNPPVHRHIGTAHTPQPSRPIAFKKFATRAWDELTLRAEAPPADDEPAA